MTHTVGMPQPSYSKINRHGLVAVPVAATYEHDGDGGGNGDGGGALEAVAAFLLLVPELC